MSILGPVYRSAAELDHDMASRFEDWLVDFTAMGVDRYAVLASLCRVLDELDRDTNGRSVIHEATVDARRDGIDDFVKVPVRVVHTSAAGIGIELGPHSLNPEGASILARALRGAVSRAGRVEERDASRGA